MHDARARWLAAHSYLEPVARLHDVVEEAASAAPAAAPSAIRWGVYRLEYEMGLPLLRGPSAAVDVVEPCSRGLERVVDAVAAAELAGPIPARARELREAVRRPNGGAEIVRWLLRGDGEAPAIPHPGLARFLGWTAMAAALRPVVEAFGAWRDEERWGRGTCPTCGALPGVGQLSGPEPARRRRLACGLCGTRWSFQRFECPYCGNASSAQLTALQVEGESGLRIDACEACKGYVKTYDGEGDEALFLADWTTLHLDVLARDQGLERRGDSLYDL